MAPNDIDLGKDYNEAVRNFRKVCKERQTNVWSENNPDERK